MVEEGDTENVGDALYTVDNTDYDASLRQAEASLDMAKVNYDSAKNGQNQPAVDFAGGKRHELGKLSLDNAEKNFPATPRLSTRRKLWRKATLTRPRAPMMRPSSSTTLKSTYELTKGTLAANTVKSAEAQLKQAQAAYDAAVSQRVDDQVTADFAGEITKIYIEEGSTVMVGAPTMDISGSWGRCSPPSRWTRTT